MMGMKQFASHRRTTYVFEQFMDRRVWMIPYPMLHVVYLSCSPFNADIGVKYGTLVWMTQSPGLDALRIYVIMK